MENIIESELTRPVRDLFFVLCGKMSNKEQATSLYMLTVSKESKQPHLANPVIFYPFFRTFRFTFLFVRYVTPV